MLSTITTAPTFYYMPPILLIIVVHFKWHRWGSAEQSRCPNWKRKKQMENRATRTQSDPVIFPISSALRDRKRIQTWRHYIKNLVWPIFSNMFVNDYEYMCAHAPSPALNSLSFKTWVTFAGALNETAPPAGKLRNQIYSIQTSNSTAPHSTPIYMAISPCLNCSAPHDTTDLVAAIEEQPAALCGGWLISLSSPFSPKERKCKPKRLSSSSITAGETQEKVALSFPCVTTRALSNYSP